MRIEAKKHEFMHIDYKKNPLTDIEWMPLRGMYV